MTTTNYNPNTPLRTDPFADWQINFLANFTQLANAFKVDHVALDAAANAGNHNYIHLFEQKNPQQTNVAEFSVYTKMNPDQTDQVFMRYQGNGTEFQFTNYQIYPLMATATQTPFFTFLPGKVICYFGSTNPVVTVGGQNLIILNPPIAKNIISVNLTPLGAIEQNGTPVTLIKEGDFVTKLSCNNIFPYAQFYIVLANT